MAYLLLFEENEVKMSSGQINKLKLDFQDKGLSPALCPYVGENYANAQILIISGGVFIKRKTGLSTVDTPYDFYENAERYYSGIFHLSKEQESEISIDSLIEPLRNLLSKQNKKTKERQEQDDKNPAIFRSIDYSDFKIEDRDFKIEERESKDLVERLAYVLSKSKVPLSETAICRFFLRPCIFNDDFNKEYDYLLDNYFVKKDKICGIIMLKNVIDTLCPQKVVFSSKKIADIVANTFEGFYQKTLKQFFKERKIVSDLESPWDEDKIRLEKILKGEKSTTDQKRLRALTKALVEIEERLRFETVDSEQWNEGVNDLRAVIDNIRMVVLNQEDKLRKPKKAYEITPEEKQKRSERMKKARELRWVKKSLSAADADPRSVY